MSGVLRTSPAWSKMFRYPFVSCRQLIAFNCRLPVISVLKLRFKRLSVSLVFVVRRRPPHVLWPSLPSATCVSYPGYCSWLLRTQRRYERAGAGGGGGGGRADCSEDMEGPLGLFSDRWTTGQLIVLLLNLRM